MWEGIGEKEMTNEEMQAEIDRLTIELMKYVLCEKFINKVETGRARSRETYAECKELLENSKAMEVER